MALVNATLMVATYTDDFGNTYSNVPIKFGDNAPAAVLTAFGYALRTNAVVCGGNLPRYALLTGYLLRWQFASVPCC